MTDDATKACIFGCVFMTILSYNMPREIKESGASDNSDTSATLIRMRKSLETALEIEDMRKIRDLRARLFL